MTCNILSHAGGFWIWKCMYGNYAEQRHVLALIVKSLKAGTRTLYAKKTWQMRNEIMVTESVKFVRLP